jgi:hypothetical protein
MHNILFQEMSAPENRELLLLRVPSDKLLRNNKRRYSLREFLLALCIFCTSGTCTAFHQSLPTPIKRPQPISSGSRIPKHYPRLGLADTRPPERWTSSTAIMGIKGFRSWFESQFPHAMCDMPKDSAHDTFDHVLIDMNQLLHICLRKSRTEGHALTLLMKELDACCRMATPTKTLVLAMDGPPSASKLATQRKRRLQTIIRTERKIQKMDQLLNKQLNSGRKPKLFSKRKQARKRRRYKSETRTLCITPGTDFMKLTEQAILYWAWQRMQHNNPNHFLSRVKVFISPSTVAGEGEVKILEWILRQQSLPGTKRRQGESIAILGGDSDLVLEGLVIPPSYTHNVFVLLPDGSKKYLSVSLWETTRALSQFLPRDLPLEALLRARTDLVLLLILNGNDYFPKLRGSSGFNKVFHTYLRTLRDWLSDQDREHHPPFLVEPDSLTYNLPFCIAFFRHLERLAPANLLWSQKPMDAAELAAQQASSSRGTPLARLNSLVDAGFVPKPISWKVREAIDGDEVDGEREMPEDDVVVNSNEETNEESEDDDEDDEEDEESEPDQVLLCLRIGKPGTEDYSSYEIWHPPTKPQKKAKQKLASMALEDLFGDVELYFDEGDGDDDDDDDDEDGGDPFRIEATYPWEVS